MNGEVMVSTRRDVFDSRFIDKAKTIRFLSLEGGFVIETAIFSTLTKWWSKR
jgi:hypothetical protein